MALRKDSADEALANIDFRSLVTNTGRWQETDFDDWFCIISAFDEEEEGDIQRLSCNVRFKPNSHYLEKIFVLDLSTGAEFRF